MSDRPEHYGTPPPGWPSPKERLERAHEVLKDYGRLVREGRIARAEPEAHRLLDEDALLNGTGCTDEPRGIVDSG